VENSHVAPDPPLAWSKILEGKTELIMATILKEHGPLMDVAGLENKCLERGINKNTFTAYLNSPIITRHTIGISSLRGAQIPVGQVETLKALIRRNRSNKVLKDYGWTKNGKIWIMIKLSPGLLRSGVFSVPSSLKKFLNGQFDLIDAEGQNINRISVKEYSGWSLNPFLSRHNPLQVIPDVALFQSEINGESKN